MEIYVKNLRTLFLSVLIISTPGLARDFNSSGTIDFTDFFLFADHFGERSDAAEFDALFDLDEDGEIGLSDFFLFADAFVQAQINNLSGAEEEEETTGDISPTTPTMPENEDPLAVGSYIIWRSELEARETELTNNPLMQQVKQSIKTRNNTIVEAVNPNVPTNPENVRRVESILSKADWEFLFPRRSPEYTYTNFLKAVAKFPIFCSDQADAEQAEAICRKSLATMFAHFTQETGGHSSGWSEPEWRQGLYFLRELGWTEEDRGGYNGECNPATWQGQTWPCGTFADGTYKSYFGRGAKQLSYNYNYGPFSKAMFGTVRTLLDNPERVADTWLNLASAIFFYIYPQPPKPSMLQVITGTWQPNAYDINSGLTSGFGVTTMIINGAVECGGSIELEQSVNRIDYYQNFANYLSVPIATDEVLGCANMLQFDSPGSGSLPIYWEMDWGWEVDTPNNQSYRCQLVNYQTPFSALQEGDYAHCVVHYFTNVVIDETQ